VQLIDKKERKKESTAAFIKVFRHMSGDIIMQSVLAYELSFSYVRTAAYLSRKKSSNSFVDSRPYFML